MVHAMKLSVEMASRFGCAGLAVDAKPEAVTFYERLGLVQLEKADDSGDSILLVIGMKQIGELLAVTDQ